jgi:hypothetical protein
VRARVEHAIGVIKRVFGFAKVRYRGSRAPRFLIGDRKRESRRYPARAGDWPQFVPDSMLEQRGFELMVPP